MRLHMRNLHKKSEFQYFFRRVAIVALVLAGVVGIAAATNAAIGQVGATEAKEQIASEIQRLQQLPAAKSADAANDLDALRQSSNSLDSGLLFASLYQLQSPFFDLVMQQYVSTAGDVHDMDAFEKEWQRAGAELSKEESALTEAKLRALPAAVRALVEANQLQSRTLYNAGHLYGQETGVQNGLAYNGLAKGMMEFAVWAAGLKFPAGSRSMVPSAGNGISGLEKEVLQAYNRPGVAEQQIRFNQVNSTLKFAAELDRAGKNEGALQQLLRAALAFGSLNGAAENQNNPGEIQKQLLAAKDRFSGNSNDQSIGEMYWEIAQSELAASANSKTYTTGNLRAAIIVSDVLPRYFRSMSGGTTAEAVAAGASSAKVTITLVRWPYT